MKRLLLISCSATKREGISLPAVRRYDGPKYRVLRKALAEGIEPPVIRILSAAYGIIKPEHPTAHYDIPLSRGRADELHFDGYWRGDFDARTLEADEVFVMAGGLYLELLLSWRRPWAGRWLIASGAPGERLRQLGLWLRQGGAS